MTSLIVALLLLLVALTLWIALRPARAAGAADAAESRRLLQEMETRLKQDHMNGVSGQLAPVNAALGQLQAGLAESREQILRQQAETMAARFEQLSVALQSALRDARAEQAKNLEALGGKVELRLGVIQADNEKKLEQIRLTVDEKLHATLEKRLGESFKLVSERLEQVQRGLGEMQSLAQDVGGLKRVLSGVKTRGILGEEQLRELLADHLTPDQYAANFRPGEGREAVEFAVRLPGDGDAPLWLPIDAKFPVEDYDRLRAAQDAGNAEAVREHEKALETRILAEAKRIRSKYVVPPLTTDFALMFLPFEGLYAEVLRRPGLHQRIRHEHQVTVTGPSTLSAFLGALRYGFATLAINHQSREIFTVLTEVREEFGKFGDWLDKVQEKIDDAGREMEKITTRSKAMDRRLKKIDALPAPEGADKPPILELVPGEKKES
jgi:DNA recombination protein RmuC